MKKTIIILLLVATAGLTKAQSVQLGLKANPIISFLQTETEGVKNNGAKLGFSYGLMLDGYFSDNYALASEFSISTMGGKFTQQDPNGSTETTYQLQYLEVPVALRLTTNPFGKIAYYGLFGFGTGFNLKARGDVETVDNNGVQTSKFEDRDLKNEVNFFRAALNMGAGIKYNLGGNTDAQLGITYSNGITDINSDDDVTLKLSYITINLGVFF